MTAIATVMWFIIFTVAHSDAGVAFPLWMGLAGVGLLLAAWWTVRVVVATAARGKDGVARLHNASAVWLMIPICLVAAVPLASTTWLLSLRLKASERALLRDGPALATVPEIQLYEEGRRVGLFRVREFARFESELRFKTSECGVVDTCGVVYSPAGPPPNRGEDSFRHLYGSWWHWYQSW